MRSLGVVVADDPLMLNLDGDGIELSFRDYGALRFDIAGFSERTGWTDSNDGLLARDLNGNGQIDDVGELFGSPTQSGFDALALEDSNGDQVIDAADTAFADLRIWQDLNRNGVTDAGELSTLADAGITAIGLGSTAPAVGEVAGNTIAAEGSFTRADGTTGTVADVRFQVDNFDSLYLGDTSESARRSLCGVRWRRIPRVAARGQACFGDR